jgi:signal peptidase II
VLDLWTKYYVLEVLLQFDPAKVTHVSELKPPRSVEVLGRRVRFVALLNPGMMWGAFQDHPSLLKLVRPLAVLVIFGLLSSLPAGQRSSRLALGGLLGGAIGNIYDSFRYVGVRDFLEVDLDVPVFDPFPAFNVADSAICVGVAVLAVGMIRGSKQQGADAPAKA